MSPAGSHPATSFGSCSGRTPISLHRDTFQPAPSSNGNAAMAVAVSRAATPARAWLATVWAGQNPAAPGWSPARWRRNPTHSSLPTGGSPAMALPRASPYSRPGPKGTPLASTAVSDGTMAATQAARGSPACRTSSHAAAAPRRQAPAASCSRRPGAGARNSWGCRVRARIVPVSSTATALVAVVPTSIPIVTGDLPSPLTPARLPSALRRSRPRALAGSGAPARAGAARRRS